MKKRKIGQRFLAMVMVLVILSGMITPMRTVDVHAADPMVPMFVPKSLVICHKIGSISQGVTFAIKGIGALNYASQNSEFGTGEWLNLALAYFSGNAGENEQINDLKSAMLEQHRVTQRAIEDLKEEIEQLRVNMTQSMDQLENTVEYTYLRLALDQFYTEFFASAYEELKTAYQNVNDVLNDSEANEATVRAKMDDLYMKAYKLRNLQGYITGDIKFNNESILDLYYEYMLRINNIQPSDSEGYEDIMEKCQEFSMRLLAADAFQKYCLAYASSYQLNYVYEHKDEMAAQGVFIGYTLDGTLDGFSNKMTLQEIKANIAKIETGSDAVSAKVAENLARIYLLTAYAGYTENGEQYFAPVHGQKLSVYQGASYQLFTLPEELQNVFGKSFSFEISDQSKGDLSDTGCLCVNGDVGSTYTVSYVYGKGVLERPLTVYSIECTVTNRTFAGGYGNEEAPYLIENVDQLQMFFSNSAYWTGDVHAKMIATIDAFGRTISPISDYRGTFDGGNYSIQNLSMSTGLFLTNNGVIKNLVLESLNLSSGDTVVGGIVNYNNGAVLNCHVKNSNIDTYRANHYGGGKGYTSFSATAGGIVGEGKEGGMIRNCSVSDTTILTTTSTRELYDAGMVFDDDDMTIYVSNFAGGIVGSANGSTIENNYVSNTNISTKTYAKYYKWSFLWSHTYNRVNVKIYTGVISGTQTGSFSNNGHSGVDNSSNSVQKLAADKSDSSFVQSKVNQGIHGNEMSQVPDYLTAIRIDTFPYKTTYLNDGTVNITGLTLLDNFGCPVYGYSITEQSTDEEGKRLFLVEYDECQTSFFIDVGCAHKNIQYIPPVTDEETSELLPASIFCLDCQTFISGEAYCTDDDKDHVCDICGVAMGIHEAISGGHNCEYCGAAVTECKDDDKNHACDICGSEMGIHEAISGGHTCGYCGAVVTECKDDDKNHACDICESEMGIHEAISGGHTCGYCGAVVTICKDENRDGVCDICFSAMSGCIDPLNIHLRNHCKEISQMMTQIMFGISGLWK